MTDTNIIVSSNGTVTDLCGPEDAGRPIQPVIDQGLTSDNAAVTAGAADPVETGEGDELWVPTAETEISDYNRWEGTGRLEGLESLADWVGDLERVGATVTSQCAGDGEAEVSWRMTLGQCYAIGWDFGADTLNAQCRYLLNHTDPEVLLYTNAQREAAVAAIQQFCLEWAKEEGPALTRCDNCGTERFDRDLREAQRLWERLEPGGEVPAGECPDCGALCYLMKEGTP